MITLPHKKMMTARMMVFVLAAILIIPLASLLAVGFYIYSRNIVIERELKAISLEAMAAKRLITRVMDSQLHLAKAWAFLDSTNRFMDDKYPDYADDIMREDFFRGFGINLLALYDLEGEKLLEQVYFNDSSRMSEGEFDIADELLPVVRRVIVRSRTFRRWDNADGYSYATDPSVGGFMQVGGSLFYVSSAPITPLDSNGPERGVLVMGKAVSHSDLASLIQLDHLINLSIHSMEEENRFLIHQEEIYRQGFSHHFDESGNVIGYQVINSLSGHDMLISAHRDGTFISDILDSFADASVIIFFTAVTVLMLMVFILDRILLRRLGQLAQIVANIENPRAPVYFPSFPSAELSSLAGALDSLLKKSAASQKVSEIQNKALIYASTHDKKTGLGNIDRYRQDLREVANDSDRENACFAVIAVELNNFRRVNETLGHAAGNEVLIGLSSRLRAKYQDSGSLYLIGNCEFGIILPGFSSKDELTNEALALIALCRQPFRVGNREIHPSVSVGLALYPADSRDPIRIEQFVDLALIEAQRELPATVHKFFEPKYFERISEQLDLEHAIVRGLARDEFDVFLQPKLDVVTNAIPDAEALVRWNSPKGMISPAKFVPLAETSGLIVPLSWRVLERSCFYLKSLHEAGFKDFGISVNMSAQVLGNSDLARKVTATLDHFGLEGRSLNIELTENVMLEDSDGICDLMNDFRNRGIQFSIDDFGTGYSSLRYLHRMPFNWVKIDKSFVDGLPHQHDSLTIIDASCAIANALGLGVVFEGVETLQQWNFIAMMQQPNIMHSHIQGYVISKPLPFGRFAAAIARWDQPAGPDFTAWTSEEESETTSS